MPSIVSCHVIDPQNIGDSLSYPNNYFAFPSFDRERIDIRDPQPDQLRDKHIIVGGGGLLFPRFLENILSLAAAKGKGKLIAWGIGQQIYGGYNQEKIQQFDYSSYLKHFDVVGIRDVGMGYDWVPCASCMHPAFDKKRDIQHEFVVFSHKKFQLKVDRFPRLTNDAASFEEVLDFLGSGETILTSSYHGAYWGTLLGRKVLAFPFSSKFHTLKHKPGLYPIDRWHQCAIRLKLFRKVLYEFRYQNKYTCKMDDWQQMLQHCVAYPDSLMENRSRNQAFHAQVLQAIGR